jgi:hypothetical protein
VPEACIHVDDGIIGAEFANRLGFVRLLATRPRSRVKRRINEVEGGVVRRMFELCAAGAGLTRITKTLNAEGVPALRPQLGRPHAWASSVRAVLRRPLYKGEVVWNQS